MEADWEMEIAPDAPIVDASWQGYVDLRNDPEAAAALPEAQQFPALSKVLQRLNVPATTHSSTATSHFWTAKCDVWIPESFDSDEMEAGPAESSAALACYIDLIPVEQAIFGSLPDLDSRARKIVSRLHAMPHRCSRIDLVLRQALHSGCSGFGITAYIVACGSGAPAAERTLEVALDALVQAISSAAAS